MTSPGHRGEKGPIVCAACKGPNTGCHLCDGKKKGPSLAALDRRKSDALSGRTGDTDGG